MPESLFIVQGEDREGDAIVLGVFSSEGKAEAYTEEFKADKRMYQYPHYALMGATLDPASPHTDPGWTLLRYL